VEEISLVNGRLKFSSRKAFDKTLAELAKQQSPEELNKWEGQWKGFVSMRTAFARITEQDIARIAASGTKGYDGCLTLVGEGEDKEVVRNVDSHVMATLVNKDGIVLIGAQAFKFNYNSLIRVSNYTDKKLSRLEQITPEN
jgi:hypothetical protein